MLKRYLPYVIGVLAILGGSFYYAQAAGCAPFLVASGGTGRCAFVTTDILFGNGTGALATSTNLTFNSATNLLSTLFASTTSITASDTASSTNLVISSTGSGSTKCLQVSGTGVVSAAGASCATGGTPGGNPGQVQYNSNSTFAGVSTTTISLVGIDGVLDGTLVGGSNRTITAQLATSSVPTISNLLYVTGAGTPTTVAGVATTSVTCSGTASCTTFTAIGASPITITGGGVANPEIIYSLQGTTKYYAASSTATDNLSWRFNNGFVSQSSSTVNSTFAVTGQTTLATSLTGLGLLTSGVISAYAGTTCTNSNSVFSLSASGVATCTLTAPYPFTPTSSFGSIASATGTQMLLTAGLSASSTINFSNVGVAGFFQDSTTGRTGIASSSPSVLWGVSIGTSTVFGGTQASSLIASTSAQAATYTVNWNSGNTSRVIANQTTAIIINATSSNPIDGGHYTLKICQDPTGGRAVTFITPGQLVWAGVTPATTTVITGANASTYLFLMYDSRVQRYTVASTTSTDGRACLVNN